LKHYRDRVTGKSTPVFVMIAGLVVAVSGGGYYLLNQSGKVRTPEAAAPTTTVSPAPVAVPVAPTAPTTVGWVDQPDADAVVGTRIAITGWALDPAGIRGVEVQIDGVPHAANFGIARPDVAQAKPGFPDSARAGFSFEGDFADLPPQRHEVAVVATNRAGLATVLARKSLLPPAAMHMWSGLLDAHPDLAQQRFNFLMMTSGASMGGADETDTAYAPYLSRTQRVGVAVPLLYMRNTKGAAGDWVFDPDFDLKHKCRDRLVAEDNLRGIIEFAVKHKVPVEFILNGGIWGDASCNSPEWDLNDHLEDDDYNVQWSQDDQTFPDDFLKGLAGSTDSPELARTLTYNVYATKVRNYKKRNLQAAARLIHDFAREHPELFVGVVLDSDTYMNPFFKQVEYFDFNPGMIRQFREWLQGTGPYAGHPGPGVPDLSSYRRPKPFTLEEVRQLARKNWKSWDEVEPPRKFPGSLYRPAVPGEPIIWDDHWYEEWQIFRQHVVGLHYDELSKWVHEAGIPKDRIFSAQGFIAPDPGNKPIAIKITSRGKNFDTSGVSFEGSIPRYGHLGAVIYGETAENKTPMEGPHNLFSQFARMDPQWGVVEFNNTNLKLPKVLPTYDQAYRSFRDLFNYDARMVSPMAWNGSNGLYADQPDYVAYTSWRNTLAEDAMKDFAVSHADLPRGARLWTFGTARNATADGWSLERGTLTAGKGFVDLSFADAQATLTSPTDQVLRSDTLETLYLGLRAADALATVQVLARIDPTSPWREIVPVTAAESLVRTAPGLAVPLKWPTDWRARSVIAESVQIVLRFRDGTDHARVDRIALYPRARAGIEARIRP
jgi:Bacterial Ig domain